MCMVPFHSCHIYLIWTSRSKEVWGMLKSSFGGGDASLKKGAPFIGKVGFHYVILLYCETLLQEPYWVIYCKRFYWIPLFTMLLLFYVFEVGKAKSATQSVLMILTLNGLFQNKFKVFTLPLKIPYPSPSHSFPLC